MGNEPNLNNLVASKRETFVARKACSLSNDDDHQTEYTDSDDNFAEKLPKNNTLE